MADAPKRFLRGSLTIAHLPLGGGRRVPLRVHWSMLLALPWFAFAFAGRIATLHDGIAPAEQWLLALLLAVALFAGVALHELSHTAVGRPLGAEVSEITLMFLGGVSQMRRGPRTPRGEVAMAAAGPAASLLLGAASWGLSLALSRALPSDVSPGLGPWVLAMFGQVNITIGVFNLLPAYPLDGGRILRGTLSLVLGPARATRAAAITGKTIALGLVGVGILYGQPFIAVLAVFVFFGADAESRAERLEQQLSQGRVAELLDPFIAAVPAAATVEEAAHRLGGARHALLVEQDGRVVGRVSAERLRAVPYGYRAKLTVAAIMSPPPPPLDPTDTLSLAFHRMSEQHVDELPVIDHGHLAGVVRYAELARWVDKRE